MAKIAVEKMALRQLLHLQGKLKTAISEVRQREREAVKEKITALAARSGFSITELYGTGSGLLGQKVAPKYVNPGNASETWAGRGRQPRWLAAQLAKGAKLEQFKI